MDWKSFFIGAITVFALLLLMTSFGLAHVGTEISGNAVANDGTGKIDTIGWTENEIMNYEMHGVIPARVQTGGAGAGMVGGC